MPHCNASKKINEGRRKVLRARVNKSSQYKAEEAENLWKWEHRLCYSLGLARAGGSGSPKPRGRLHRQAPWFPLAVAGSALEVGGLQKCEWLAFILVAWTLGDRPAFCYCFFALLELLFLSSGGWQVHWLLHNSLGNDLQLKLAPCFLLTIKNQLAVAAPVSETTSADTFSLLVVPQRSICQAQGARNRTSTYTAKWWSLAHCLLARGFTWHQADSGGLLTVLIATVSSPPNPSYPNNSILQEVVQLLFGWMLFLKQLAGDMLWSNMGLFSLPPWLITLILQRSLLLLVGGKYCSARGAWSLRTVISVS